MESRFLNEFDKINGQFLFYYAYTRYDALASVEEHGKLFVIDLTGEDFDTKNREYSLLNIIFSSVIFWLQREMKYYFAPSPEGRKQLDKEENEVRAKINKELELARIAK